MVESKEQETPIQRKCRSFIENTLEQTIKEEDILIRPDRMEVIFGKAEIYQEFLNRLGITNLQHFSNGLGFKAYELADHERLMELDNWKFVIRFSIEARFMEQYGSNYQIRQ